MEQLKANNIYNCDCLDFMDEIIRGGVKLPNGEIRHKVDWVITDVPYGIGIEKMGFTKGARRYGNSKCISKDYSSVGSWDSKPLDKKYFDKMIEVSENQIIFGGNYYANILSPTKSWIVWDKRLYNLLDRNDFADFELAWCSKGQGRMFRYLWNGMLQQDMKDKEERFHPTQKPHKMIMQLLDYYTKENDLVLDPFSGSGSISVACRKMNRNYIACELNEEYYKKSIEWINKEFAQTSLLWN